jgi:hypothetical protein
MHGLGGCVSRRRARPHADRVRVVGGLRSRTGNLKPVVPRGQPVQIAFADSFTGFTSGLATSLANAVDKAVAAHPDGPRLPDPDQSRRRALWRCNRGRRRRERNHRNTQNVAALGQVCSTGFDQALPVYEAAGLVTISGSATNDALPSFGPTVFNRTFVDDGDGADAWYAAVAQLPSDGAWRQAYALEFGRAPTAFADLYYDAASLLIRDLQKVAGVDRRGDLVVISPLLACAVRLTRAYAGVTCTVTFDPSTGNRLNDPSALSNCAG